MADTLDSAASGRWIVHTRAGSAYVLDLPPDGCSTLWKTNGGADCAGQPRVLHAFHSLEGGPVRVGERMSLATTTGDDAWRVLTTSEVVGIQRLP